MAADQTPRDRAIARIGRGNLARLEEGGLRVVDGGPGLYSRLIRRRMDAEQEVERLTRELGAARERERELEDAYRKQVEHTDTVRTGLQAIIGRLDSTLAKTRERERRLLETLGRVGEAAARVSIRTPAEREDALDAIYGAARDAIAAIHPQGASEPTSESHSEIFPAGLPGEVER